MYDVFTIGINLAASGFSNGTEQMNNFSAATTKAGNVAVVAREKFANLAGAFTALVAAKMVVDTIKGVVKPMLAMEHAVIKLRNALGSTMPIARAMAESVQEMAIQRGFAPEQAIDALIELKRALGSPKEAQKLLDPTLMMSQAMGRSMGPDKLAKEFVRPLAQGFRLSTEEIVGYMDGVQGVADKVGVTLDVFSKGSMANLVQASLQSGASLKDLTVGFMLAAEGADKGSKASADLLRFLQQMQKIPAKKTPFMAVMGLDLVDPLTGKPTTPKDFMNKLGAEFQRDRFHLQNVLVNTFSRGTSNAVFAMLQRLMMLQRRTGAGSIGDVWESLGGTLEASSGALAAKASEWSRSLEEAFQRVILRWDEMKESVGYALAPALKYLAVVFEGVLKVMTAIANNPVGQFFLSGIARMLMFSAGVFALKSALWGLSSIMKVAAENVKGVGGALTAGITKLKLMSTEAGRAKLAMHAFEMEATVVDVVPAGWLAGQGAKQATNQAAKAAAGAAAGTAAAAATAAAANVSKITAAEAAAKWRAFEKAGMAGTAVYEAAGATGAASPKALRAAKVAAENAAPAVAKVGTAADQAAKSIGKVGTQAAKAGAVAATSWNPLLMILTAVVMYLPEIYEGFQNIVASQKRMREGAGTDTDKFVDTLLGGASTLLSGMQGGPGVIWATRALAKVQEERWAREKAETQKKVDLEKQAADYVLRTMEQGTKAWNDVMTRAQDMFNYKPAVVKYSALEFAEKMLKGPAVSARTPEARAWAKSALGDVGQMKADFASWYAYKKSGRLPPPDLVRRIYGSSLAVLGHMRKLGTTEGWTEERIKPIKEFAEGMKSTTSEKTMLGDTAFAEHRGEKSEGGRPWTQTVLRDLFATIPGRADKQEAWTMFMKRELIPALEKLTDAMKDKAKHDAPGILGAFGIHLGD